MTDPDTKIEAYREIRDAGEDVALRRRVAAAVAETPRTTYELSQVFDDHSANAIRPRVNELIRMGVLKRDGKRENPSGHDAYVVALTDLGHDYLDGDADPDPGPTISELKTEVVSVARRFVKGDVDQDVLHLVVDQHDDAKRRMDPEWSPGE